LHNWFRYKIRYTLQHVLLLKRQYGFDIFWMILVILKRSLHLSTMTIKLQFNLWSILDFKNAPKHIHIQYYTLCEFYQHKDFSLCLHTKPNICQQLFFNTSTVCSIFNLSLKWEKKTNQDHWPFSYHSNEWEHWMNTLAPFNI
jgi:hypothetical protein